jgi:hypothetical protein
MDIHQDCLILLASATNTFVGVNGMEDFVRPEGGRPCLETAYVKPKA